MKKIPHKDRFVWFISYFTLGVLIIWFSREQIFYLEPKETFNFFRFLWCVACSCFGFSVLVCRLAFQERTFQSTIPTYITYYPPLLIVISCIAFSAFSIFKATYGYIFYYASFALCFILAFLVDNLWEIVFKVLIKRNE